MSSPVFEATAVNKNATPFSGPLHRPKRIAVIGGGISGMGAAYMLGDAHDVTLFEAKPKLGGHARTVMAGRNGDQPVDTGFIVFNRSNYPHLVDLFKTLDVPVIKSNMSFGASIDGGRLEYALTSLNALFAQRSNAVNPAFLGMIRDILKFNKHALRTAKDQTMTVAEFLSALGTGTWFRDYYLLPLSGAIWSTPTQQIMDFPAHAMIQFFENHALLGVTGQHQWYTVQGGSASYVDRLQAAMVAKGVQLRVGAAVQSVERGPLSVRIKARAGEVEEFDEVIFATHSDDTLRLIADPDPQETRTLGAILYQPNEVVLHADTSLMPRRRKTWASWVYTEDSKAVSDSIDLTYWMNSLQPIPPDDPHFVTLNTRRAIRQELIYDQVTFRHPVYDIGAFKAQRDIQAFNGQNRTWFCGAWMKRGFHEDGLSSAVDVVHAMEMASAASVAAE
ncbi:MAG: FAD-dependent oxidoreductase [Sulfitobacter sp.]